MAFPYVVCCVCFVNILCFTSLVNNSLFWFSHNYWRWFRISEPPFKNYAPQFLAPCQWNSVQFSNGMPLECSYSESEALPDDESNDNIEEVCFDEIGCFSQQYPWVSMIRPFPPPKSPQEMDVKLYLITRNYYHTEYPIRPLHDLEEQIANVDFSSKRKHTAIVIHGFSSSGNSTWLRELAESYLLRRDANVFIVDWGGGANKASYLQVAANTRVVSAVLSRLFNFLIERKGLKPATVHCVGHSLGSHICGYVGKNIKGIWRITALDSAQIGFEGASEEVRLYHEDAEFIDVIHTNGKPTVPTLGLGFVSPIGDVDFYINGGFHQPSCAVVSLSDMAQFPTPYDLAKLPVEMISEVISCSHSKSIEYFNEAIRNIDCIFWGYKVGILDSAATMITLGRVNSLLKNNTCSLETCTPMGLETYIYPARGKFSVTTAVNSPYCDTDPKVTEKMEHSLFEFYNSHDLTELVDNKNK